MRLRYVYVVKTIINALTTIKRVILQMSELEGADGEFLYKFVISDFVSASNFLEKILVEISVLFLLRIDGPNMNSDFVSVEIQNLGHNAIIDND